MPTPRSAGVVTRSRLRRSRLTFLIFYLPSFCLKSSHFSPLGCGVSHARGDLRAPVIRLAAAGVPPRFGPVPQTARPRTARISVRLLVGGFLIYFGGSDMKKTVSSPRRPAPSAPPPQYPLSQLRVGDSARIKRLAASPEVSRRLREMGLRENQDIRLLSRNFSLICQVSNARIGLSTRLGDDIFVEKLNAA